MLKWVKYTQLPAETFLLYLLVNSFMTCKNLTSHLMHDFTKLVNLLMMHATPD